ncbi:VanZ family protein [Microbacterium hydrocarbonoxydans]|uniref:VanZ family protein n=1 Tax=Microbacterium hydrocarbonoxydans TaxID=273678 RepID=UPI003D97827B
MSDPFEQIPVLPVVVPLGILVFGLLLWRLVARRIFSVPRALVAAALAVYAAGIVGNTVFPIYLHPLTGGDEWTPGLALVPFADYEWEDATMNILIFVPLGMLVVLLLATPSWWKVLLVVVGTSGGIETLQLAAQRYFAGGHIADVNDLLSNIVGGMLGYALLVVLSRVPVLSGVIGRFRWTSSPSRDLDPAPYDARTEPWPSAADSGAIQSTSR